MKTMNIDRALKKERRNLFIRRILYFILAPVFFVLMTSGANLGLPTPLLLISCCTAAGMYECESPVYCACYGAFCGILLDISQGVVICFNGILLGFLSMLCALSFLFWFRKKTLNYFFISLVMTFTEEFFHYVFFYLLWGYDDSGEILKGVFLTEFISTAVFGLLIYLIYFLVFKFLGNINGNYIES